MKRFAQHLALWWLLLLSGPGCTQENPGERRLAIPDTTQNLSAIRTAAERGDVTAQMEMGARYFEGREVPQSNTRAALWYRMAAEHGEARAQTILGLFFLLGDGLPQDNAKGRYWLGRAAEQGDPTARQQLTLLRQEHGQE